MIRFIGLDIHKRVVQACFVDEAGEVSREHRFNLSRQALLDFAAT